MKNFTLLMSLGLGIASMASAGQHAIRVDTFSYTAAAATHLDHLQRAIAQKAIETCGSREAIAGLSAITIKIVNGLHSTTAILARDTNSLELIYPKMVATTMVDCVGK